MNKSNLPWIRQYYGSLCEQKRPSRYAEELVAVLLVGAVSFVLCMGIYHAIDSTQAAIEEAYLRGRVDMRTQILKANQDILRDHKLYIAQMDALVEREYRSKR